MNILFWIACIITLAEFTASSVNTLLGSAMHMQRLKEVGFPRALANVLAVVELLAVVAVVGGVWAPISRHIGGIVLAACFVPYVLWAARARRPAGDILALLFFIACAMFTAVY